MQTVQSETVRTIRPMSIAQKEKTNLKSDPNHLIRIYLYINFVFDDDALFQHKTESEERRTSDW